MWEKVKKMKFGAGAIREPLSKSVQLPAPPLCAAASQSFGETQFVKVHFFRTCCFCQKITNLETFFEVPILKTRLRPTISTAPQADQFVQSSSRRRFQSPDNRRISEIGPKFRPLAGQFRARSPVSQIDLETPTLLKIRRSLATILI